MVLQENKAITVSFRDFYYLAKDVGNKQIN